MARQPKPSAHGPLAEAGVSAGILLYRLSEEGIRVLLAHPGGPYWVNKDLGAWSIPKGLINSTEDYESAARREFEEELGWKAEGPLEPLGEVKLRSGKRVFGFALKSAEDEPTLLARFQPGLFTMEWPPRSGQAALFPEVDRIEFFSMEQGRLKLNPAQAPFLDRLREAQATAR
jgi:predicted NUDIX family NTP pyrophosphohydrolase